MTQTIDDKVNNIRSAPDYGFGKNLGQPGVGMPDFEHYIEVEQDRINYKINWDLFENKKQDEYTAWDWTAFFIREGKITNEYDLFKSREKYFLKGTWAPPTKNYSKEELVDIAKENNATRSYIEAYIANMDQDDAGMFYVYGLCLIEDPELEQEARLRYPILGKVL